MGIHHGLPDGCGGLAAQQANLLAKFGWAKKCKTAYERAVELDALIKGARQLHDVGPLRIMLKKAEALIWEMDEHFMNTRHPDDGKPVLQ